MVITVRGTLFFGAILFVLIEIVFLIRKMPIKKNILWSLFIIYLIVVASLTVFPIELFSYEPRGIAYSIIPFKNLVNLSASGVGVLLKNVIGNIALCVPFGAFITLFNYKKITLWQVFLFGALFSVGIEFSQLLIDVFGLWLRTVDIDDVILNTLGAALGFLVVKLIPEKYIKLITE